MILAKVERKDTETVVGALIRQAHKLPRELYKSLTSDRGKEMADHKRFTLDTDIKVREFPADGSRRRETEKDRPQL